MHFFKNRIDFLGESEDDISKSQSQSQLLQRDYTDDSHLFEELQENFDDPKFKDEYEQQNSSRSFRSSDHYFPASMMFFMLCGSGWAKEEGKARGGS